MDLDKYSILWITVIAMNDAGSSGFTLTAMTLESAPSGPPTRVSAKSNHDYITVNWKLVQCVDRNGPITHYLVKYSGGGMTHTISVTGGYVKQTTLSGLIVCTKYTINVAAVNRNGIGPYSDDIAETVEDYLSVSVISSSATSLTISWTLVCSSTALTYTISYSNTDCPTDTYDDITGIAGNETMYTPTGLEEGTEYSITVTATLSGEETKADRLKVTTMAAAPSAAPSSVNVSLVTSTAITVQWGPVNCAHRNGMITGYSVRYGEMGSESTHTMRVSENPSATISELSAATMYTVEVAAETSAGTGVYSDPLTVETPADSTFQLRFTEISDCYEFMSDNRDAKLEDITIAVLRKLTVYCAECSRDIIDMQSFSCFPESPSHVTYRARLAGTSETDSGSLISLIEQWVRGGADIVVAGLLMTVDPKCSVKISSFYEVECSVSIDSGTIDSTRSACPTISTGSIIGGVVAVILIITFCIIIVVVLTLKFRHGDSKNKKYEVDSPLTTQRGSVIATTSNTAYEMTKLGGEMSGREYEVVGVAPVSEKAVEVMYEMPSAPPSHQPLPTIPPTETTPTGGDVGVASEEEDGVYDNTPGDQ